MMENDSKCYLELNRNRNRRTFGQTDEETDKRFQTCILRNLGTAAASVQEPIRNLQTGDKLHGYTVQKTVEVPELLLTAVTLEHDKTGAQHLHVARDDSNNTFGVLFRTTPMDDTGVPHILEHTTLCGSRKFPVRDPFFKMLNRSLATFMNAMTASDWTVYPFSTQNKQDYRNLMSVYLDAVFYPQLRELDFKQEGWRLENENPDDKTSPLIFKGVVYNEMKGVFSNAQDIYRQAAQNKLLPSHTYGVVSGGDPKAITDLTWDHLKNFHATHYHPSNAKFMTYGNFPLEEHLQFIDDNYLSSFDRISVNTSVPNETRWNQSVSSHISCMSDPMAPDPAKQTTISASYLLSDITDTFESFVLSILCTLLTDGENSPFYQSLIVPNIGSDYSPVLGYDGYSKEATFSVGLQGIHPDDVSKVEQIISDTFDQVIKEGFEQKRIDALLHSIELSLKHQTSNFGLGLLLNMSSVWNHDGDILRSLEVNKLVTKFKETLQSNPQFLQQKVKQYFKDNHHKLTLTMSPEENYEARRSEEEVERLKLHVDSLTVEDKDIIYHRGVELKEKQMQVEDMSCLPTLRVSEIDRKIIQEPIHVQNIDGVQVQSSEQPTNEVTYIRMISDLSGLTPDLQSYVPLFTEVITEMGAGSMDYRQLSQEAELHTGGLDADTHVVTMYDNNDLVQQGVVFSSYCLDRNLDKMLELWTEIFCRSNIRDIERLRTLIQGEAANLASSITSAGHSYAMTHSASKLTQAAKIKEMYDGMTQVATMKSLAEGDDAALHQVLEKLESIGRHVLNKNNFRLSVNSTPTQMSKSLSSIQNFIKAIPGTCSTDGVFSKDDGFQCTEGMTQFELPFSVNYVSKSVKGVQYSHPDYEPLRILARMLWAKYLHREIREKGGAYGSGVVNAPGVISFFSYRDPNSMKTLQVFDDSVRWACDGKFTDEDIDEAKLSVFQQIDKPITPGRAGMTYFVNRISDELRQSKRDQIFNTNRSHLLDVAHRYLGEGRQASAVTFLGPSNQDVTEKWNVIKS
ncbi:hypothetical protein FSP39_012452 [Pinctada imbricata]|uniref:Presequence protease, mitochondrial n=1 Tax=Pinctada imbricata TaxID=66713 RepID=A0AA89C1H6_PINIB|nr:hypothetical protein FSP39_012452 [Pinctada imbricata]